jgi:hypothetical protein
MYAEEHHRPDYNEMLSTVYGLMSKYNVDSVYIDGANPSFIKSLKLQIGEDADYDKVIARYRSDGLGDSWTKDMRIVPVNFNKEHKAMLGHCKMILESDGGRIAINPDKFDKLITSLRTAVDIDGTLDKESTSYNDIFDAFRLALKFYHFEKSDLTNATVVDDAIRFVYSKSKENLKSSEGDKEESNEPDYDEDEDEDELEEEQEEETEMTRATQNQVF